MFFVYSVVDPEPETLPAPRVLNINLGEHAFTIIARILRPPKLGTTYIVELLARP
jgi:hypothetical protein